MPSVRVVSFESQFLPSVIKLARLIHPSVKDIEKRFQWFTLDHPWMKQKNGIPEIPGYFAVTEGGEVVGQFIFNACEWFDGEKRALGYVGYDFFVREDYRGSGIGAMLLIQSLRTFKPFLGLGLTNMAEKLFTKLGVKSLGSIQKFIWVNRPLSSFGHYLQGGQGTGRAMKKFPSSICVARQCFQLYRTMENSFLGSSGKAGIIEFARTREFLKWRFFDSPRTYFFYALETEPQVYFVARPVVVRGMAVLLLVDYHVPMGRGDETIVHLIKAAKLLTKRLKLDGLVTMSSHRSFSQLLKKAFFWGLGKPSSVVTTLDQFSTDHRVRLTMADADLDLNFGDHDE